MGLYEREVRFYTDIAPGLEGPVAQCYHAAYDPDSGAFDLVLSDAAPAVVGDEIRGASPDQARLALTRSGSSTVGCSATKPSRAPTGSIASRR